jgi:hypothetical protein
MNLEKHRSSLVLIVWIRKNIHRSVEEQQNTKQRAPNQQVIRGAPWGKFHSYCVFCMAMAMTSSIARAITKLGNCFVHTNCILLSTFVCCMQRFGIVFVVELVVARPRCTTSLQRSSLVYRQVPMSTSSGSSDCCTAQGHAAISAGASKGVVIDPLTFHCSAGDCEESILVAHCMVRPSLALSLSRRPLSDGTRRCTSARRAHGCAHATGGSLLRCRRPHHRHPDHESVNCRLYAAPAGNDRVTVCLGS